MKIAIVHLSDIHFCSENDPVFDRAGKIAAAATSQSSDIDAYFVVVTGDLANWGVESEYQVAEKFLNSLVAAIRDRAPRQQIELIVIPGNHDCDFTTDRNRVDVRSAVLKTILADLPNLDLSGGLAMQCVSVQENFFNLLKRLPGYPVITDEQKIVLLREAVVGTKTVRFQCLNSAWVSQIVEIQGDHLFPVEQAREVLANGRSSADLVVSLLHHPFNWFESTNARALEGLLNVTSDVILTGHEHVSDVFVKDKLTGPNVEYFAGAVLQEKGSKDSGFGLVILDLETSLQMLVKFAWETDKYVSQKLGDWIPFNRNRLLQKYGLNNSLEFQKHLDDIGTEFTHPFRKRGGLSFNDLFITPDANEYPFRLTQRKKKLIKSEHLLESLRLARFSVVYGEENSGKTALSKKLYQHLRACDLVPVLLRPTDGLASHDEISLRACLDRAIEAQYSVDAVDQIFQLPIENRALIIDDLHHFSLSTESRRALLKAVQRLFGTVIVFATDVYQYQSLIERSEKPKSQDDYTEFKIREFGRKLRGRLIRRWLQIGREMIVDPKDIAHEEDVLEKALNATISRNVIPSYPFWIISILQLWNSEKTNNGSFGAFGYIFDGLIAKQLEDIGYDATQIDKIYTFLGRLAYHIFDREDLTTSYEEMRRISNEYFRDYKVQLRFDQLLERLENARLIRNIDGNYKFTQPYILYFFVARYYRENLAANANADELRGEIFNMISHVSYEPYSYILLILVYLTKDYDLIRRIVEQSDRIYANVPTCDLDESVAFLNDLNPQIEPIALPGSDFDTNREEYRARIDATENVDEEVDDIALVVDKERIVGYSEDLDELSKLIFAMKSLDLMGQILRNFPGSLYGDMKLQLAESCYRLGLRTLEAFMTLARENLAAFQVYYTKVLKERRPSTSKGDPKRAAKDMLLWLTGGASFSVIKRVSTAVGHEDLSEIYAEVVQQLDGTNAVQLIDLSVKLDHFSGVPHTQINKLAKNLRKNPFAYSVERDLINHFLYLFPVAQSDLQKLKDKFAIDVPQSRLLLNDAKRSTRRRSKNRAKSK